MSNKNRKIALITGASRGIGAAIARRLASDGFNVIINYSGDAAPADALAREIESAGGQAITAKADVSDPIAVRGLFDAAETAFGGIDVLVNNAGVMTLAPIGQMEEDAFDRLVNVNLKGTFNTLHQAATRLRAGGRIINFSSSVVGLQLPTYAVYAATKSAVETLSGFMAKEMRGRNITVNTVAPGPTATDLFTQGKSQELMERMAKMAPLERLGQPEDIAGVVSFLADPDGGWVNGQTLRANGGLI